MTRRIQVVVFTLVLAVALGAVWQGCGGSDHHGPSATFSGNISSVSPALAAADTKSQRSLAERLSLSSTAHAQSTCGSHLIVCVTSGGSQPIVCAPVDPGTCQFDVSLDILNEFATGTLAFFNDTNGNLKPDNGEAFGVLTNDVRPVCNGSVVILSDVVIDFTTFSATAAGVDKNPDTCSATPTVTGTPPTATPRPPNTPPGGNPTHTPTPTGTITPGTPTPTRTATRTPTTYPYGASLHEPPSTMLAFLFGVGAFGLVVPRRRSRARRK